MRARVAGRFAVSAQVVLLVGALVGPGVVAAATMDFTLSAPSVSTVNYSDFVTFRGTYTCINGGSDPSDCTTSSQTRVASFSIRPSGGSTFTTAATVSTTFVFTSNPSGCPSTCSVPFQVTWKAGRIGAITVPPGVYDIGLTTTISPGQLVLLSGLTITQEATTTTYTGATSGLGGNALALGANVVDLDRGLGAGNGIITPDVNLGGASMVTFALYDATNTTLVVGPVSATLASSGLTSGSPTLTPPTSGGSFRMRTTYVGNSFYTTSSDLDTIAVTPTNTAPTLTVPAGPIVEEATSPAGATVNFVVSASDLEDEPDPVPSCDWSSGATFPLGATTVTCSVVDSGGMGVTKAFVVNVQDTTDPWVSVSTSEGVGGSGWHNVAANDGTPGVTVDVSTGDLVGVDSVTCTDNGVGVGALSSSGDSFVVADGTHGVACSVSDAAGNTDGDSMSFDVDQTLPSISSSLAPAMAATGWWNAATGAPTVTWSCGDTGSGLASCTPPSTFGEGAGQSATGTAMDVAGNAKVGTVSGVNVDLTPPGAVSLIGGGLTDGASYGFGHVPAGPTGCSSVDTLSGLASCQVSGYSTSVGWHTVTGLALDVAGNSASASISYNVGPWTIVGFDKPVDMGSMNSQKGGAPVPLKFEVFVGSVELTTLDAIASIEQQRFSCDTSAPMGTPTAIPAAPGFTLRYDAGAGQFVGKWDSPKLPGTCWLVNLRTADGSSISAAFKLK